MEAPHRPLAARLNTGSRPYVARALERLALAAARSATTIDPAVYANRSRRPAIQ